MADELRVFIVEDEAQIARFLTLELGHEGFVTATESNGRRAYERIMQEKFDIVLLDWMLPDMEGVEICRRVRQISDVPIIMLTAKDEVKDKVMGLDVGADDYLTKPFAIEELLARIRATLRKRGGNGGNENERELLTAGDVILDPSACEVRVNGELVDLTHKEFQVLEFLLRSKKAVVSREQILSGVWGYDYMGDTNAVDVYIRYLRQKLESNQAKKIIFTVRGVGYVIKD